MIISQQKSSYWSKFVVSREGLAPQGPSPMPFQNLNVVSREGLEPSTPGLKGPCSNQLSYRPKFLMTS